MTYIHIQNGAVSEYPVYEGDIRLRFSNVSFALPFEPPQGFELVKDAVPPVYNYRKNVVEGDPAIIEGEWTRVWVVTDATAEQIAERVNAQWQAIRTDRTRRLADTDWTQLDDTPLANTAKQQWASYRQALRDITTQPDPFNIEWPANPV
jgi:hypothetical protein